MRKFKLFVATVVMSSILFGCGSSAPEPTKQTEEIIEETVEAEPEESADDVIEIVDNFTFNDYANDNEIYTWDVVFVKNCSSDIIIRNLTVDVKAYCGDELINVETAIAPYIYCGDTAIMATRLCIPRDKAETGNVKFAHETKDVFSDTNIDNFISMSELEFSDVSTIYETEGMCIGTITNNSDKDQPTTMLNVVCYKEGKVAGVLQQTIDPINAGESINFKLSGAHSLPPECDDFKFYIANSHHTLP